MIRHRLAIWDGFGNDCLLSWYDLEAFAQAARAEAGDSRLFEHFEWMAGPMMDLDRRSGSEPISRDTVATLLPVRIAAQEERLGVEVALRSPGPAPVPSSAVTA
jgi:hypothetical protein